MDEKCGWIKVVIKIGAASEPWESLIPERV